MDIWIQYGAIVTGLVIAALGPYVPNSGVLSKRMYYAAIVGLGIFSCVLSYSQTKEKDLLQIAAQRDQKTMRQKLDASLEGQEFLKRGPRILEGAVTSFKEATGNVVKAAGNVRKPATSPPSPKS